MQFLPLFIFLALLAEILGTVGGFGSSMFFVPIAGYFLIFILLVVGIIGTFIGKKLVARFSEIQFRFSEIQFKYTVLIPVFVTGCITLFSSLALI